MLFIVLLLYLLSSVVLVILNKDKKTWLMLALCLTFLLMFAGIMIYFAKTGGLTLEQRRFFFLNNRIQQRISFLNISLPRIGYMIALGRYLFPMLLLLLAWEYNRNIAKYRKYLPFFGLIPALSLIVYYPKIFFQLFSRHSRLQNILIIMMILWIVSYVILSVVLLLQEYFYSTICFQKRSFRNIVIFLCSIASVYLCYAVQDPVQVYRLYSIEYSNFFARSYLSWVSNVWMWYSVTIIACILIGLAFWSIQKYSKWKIDEEAGELKLQKKFKDAYQVVPIFVHGIKNQVLAERIVEKRLRTELSKNSIVSARVDELLQQLEDMNRSMLNRMEELYCSVKTNYMNLTLTAPQEIIKAADERFRQKYPWGKVAYSCEENKAILADKIYLGEAVGNLLTNAYEASLLNPEQKVECKIISEKGHLLILVKDNGVGIKPSERKRIFEPFYTNKNTNSNWGMGLVYTLRIVQEHLGVIRVESEPGKSTSFYVYIPLYK